MIPRRISWLFLFLFATTAMSAEPLSFEHRLSDEQVSLFARLALDGLNREYPNKPSEIMVGPESILSPRQMHPVFYGCFDWHSSIHGHWMLVRLLKEYPDSSLAEEIRTRLAAQFTTKKLETEAQYFREEHNESFERMYGWAWTLRLAGELHTWQDRQAAEWKQNLQPLETVIVERAMDYLPKLTWPIRTGVHPDSGFALGLMLDYARTAENKPLESLIVQRSLSYYQEDRDYPVRYEPSGEDFFSPGLNEADLMRRVLPEAQFPEWLDQFFPTLKSRELGNLLRPVQVSDSTDGKLVHLAGLNLSRAWTLRGIASAIPHDDPRHEVLQEAAMAHLTAGLRYVASGNYEGDHWLATFAIYALNDAGLKPE